MYFTVNFGGIFFFLDRGLVVMLGRLGSAILCLCLPLSILDNIS